MTQGDQHDAAQRSGISTLTAEMDGIGQLIAALRDRLAGPFGEAVSRIRSTQGRVIVTGVGKSGHVGVKIAATLASTGTPAFFVHAAEANHGDLGMITRDDVILALSWSGETAELHAIVAHASRFDVDLIAMTGREDSALARAADIILALPAAQEACPHGLAPTTSTTMMLALGDALAVALLEARGFTAHEFRGFHPGGKLGASLKPVGDLMHSGSAMPILPSGASMRDALVEMSAKGFGCAIIVQPDGSLAGIITDGDLRRHMDVSLIDRQVDQVMTRNPQIARPDMLAAEVLAMLNSKKITAIVVVDHQHRPTGIVHLHDLLRIGVA